MDRVALTDLHQFIEHLIEEGLLYLVLFGDIVFAISGALVAARHRMDLFGFVLLGTITGIGGGTMRDLALNRPAFWLSSPVELLLCIGASAAVFILLFFWRQGAQGRLLAWADALGLSAFAVVGTEVAIAAGAHPISAACLGVLNAVGGGLLRDLIAGERPYILTGELYAAAALGGSITFLLLSQLLSFHMAPAALCGFLVVLGLRSLSLLFGLRLGAPGEDWIRSS